MMWRDKVATAKIPASAETFINQTAEDNTRLDPD